MLLVPYRTKHFIRDGFQVRVPVEITPQIVILVVFGISKTNVCSTVTLLYINRIIRRANVYKFACKVDLCMRERNTRMSAFVGIVSLRQVLNCQTIVAIWSVQEILVSHVVDIIQWLCTKLALKVRTNYIFKTWVYSDFFVCTKNMSLLKKKILFCTK